MSIIVQAGHDTSKSKLLMQKLYERGLSKPVDSYTHKMTSQQLSETLYKVLAQGTILPSNEKISDNIMTDFLLANLDSENWGWESKKNLATLEYWQKIEPNTCFVLVFDHPKNLFKNIEIEKLTVENINATIGEWVYYHQNILKIIENYKNISILVEGESALQNIFGFNTQLKRIASNVELKSRWQVPNIEPINNEPAGNENLELVMELISEEILKNYADAIRVFNDLLSKADLKSSKPIHKSQRTKLVSLVKSLVFVKSTSQSTVNEYELKISVLEDEKSDLVLLHSNLKEMFDKKNTGLQSKLDSLESGLKDSQNNIKSLKSELKKQTSRDENADSLVDINEIEKENELLIKKMHQIQEESEKYYIENQKIKQYLKDNQIYPEGIKQTHYEAVYYGAAERVKSDLPYRLGKKVVQAKSPQAMALLPLSLLKEYKAFQKDVETAERLPPVDTYIDAYEADKVKKHLSYRVGKTLVEGSKSPKKIFLLPKELGSEVLKFYKTK